MTANCQVFDCDLPALGHIRSDDVDLPERCYHHLLEDIKPLLWRGDTFRLVPVPNVTLRYRVTA